MKAHSQTSWPSFIGLTERLVVKEANLWDKYLYGTRWSSDHSRIKSPTLFPSVFAIWGGSGICGPGILLLNEKGSIQALNIELLAASQSYNKFLNSAQPHPCVLRTGQEDARPRFGKQSPRCLPLPKSSWNWTLCYRIPE